MMIISGSQTRRLWACLVIGGDVQTDICRDPLPDGHFDWIIHAAGIASPYYYRAYPLETLEVATVGTQRLLERAKQAHAKFLYFSSSEIYGDPDPTHVPTLESYRGNVSTLGPWACYDEGKRVGETYCYIYHDYYGVHTNIVRPFNVYGPGMQKSDYRVMPNYAAQIAAKKPLMIYGDGQQTRTFCYIVDAMIGFFRVPLKGVPGEVYNIGNPKPEVTMNDLATAFAKISPTSVTVQTTEYPDYILQTSQCVVAQISAKHRCNWTTILRSILRKVFVDFLSGLCRVHRTEDD